MRWHVAEQCGQSVNVEEPDRCRGAGGGEGETKNGFALESYIAPCLRQFVVIEEVVESVLDRPVTGERVGGGGAVDDAERRATTPGSVRAAVAAGLGVAVLSTRLLDDDVVAWERAVDFDPLPVMYQIVRTVPGESPDIAAALVDLIVTEFQDLPERPAPVGSWG